MTLGRAVAALRELVRQLFAGQSNQALGCGIATIDFRQRSLEFCLEVVSRTVSRRNSERKASGGSYSRLMMKTLLKSACLIILLIAASAQAVLSQEAQRGITPEDYFAFEFLGDPHISPDGKLVAYVVTKIDRAQNRRNSAIWLTATDGSRAPWQSC